MAENTFDLSAFLRSDADAQANEHYDVAQEGSIADLLGEIQPMDYIFIKHIPTTFGDNMFVKLFALRTNKSGIRYHAFKTTKDDGKSYDGFPLATSSIGAFQLNAEFCAIFKENVELKVDPTKATYQYLTPKAGHETYISGKGLQAQRKTRTPLLVAVVPLEAIII